MEHVYAIYRKTSDLVSYGGYWKADEGGCVVSYPDLPSLSNI